MANSVDPYQTAPIYRPVGSNYRLGGGGGGGRGGTHKFLGGTHNFFFLFLFFFGGGGAYLCKLLGGGARPPCPPPYSYGPDIGAVCSGSTLFARSSLIFGQSISI